MCDPTLTYIIHNTLPFAYKLHIALGGVLRILHTLYMYKLLLLVNKDSDVAKLEEKARGLEEGRKTEIAQLKAAEKDYEQLIGIVHVK